MNETLQTFKARLIHKVYRPWIVPNMEIEIEAYNKNDARKKIQEMYDRDWRIGLIWKKNP